ncbi:MAG: hypothetical protein KAT17_07615 [Candidatus Aminicenantes bacterium]|nr:hypothetical protein [Candidatus Aminicenantes bacterium]
MNTSKCQQLVDSLLSRYKSPSSFENPFPNLKEIDNKKSGDIVLKTLTLKIKENKYKIDFGNIFVPENRNRMDSRLIPVPLIKWHALIKNPSKPILWLGSGIKSSSILRVELKCLLKEIGWMLNHHDVVMVGYRGMEILLTANHSEVQEVLKIENNPISCEDLKKLGNVFYSSFQKLKDEGIDLEGYNIFEIVDDLEEVRKGLRYQKINLFSTDYGVILCYSYGLRYSEHINQIFMGNSETPSYFLFKPDLFDLQLKYYSRLYNQNSHYI